MRNGWSTGSTSRSASTASGRRRWSTGSCTTCRSCSSAASPPRRS
ncbi:hypothetical protein KTE17_35160 [Burkholderia gladioli]|nr:hypothetical protein [Burkholderia gladioli]MBU9278314.1 hypothetical protein [Burkholderia gladioli]